MGNIRDWFNRPSFAKSQTQTPEKFQTKQSPESSPLSEPPTSFNLDDLSPQTADDAEAQLKAAIHLSTQEENLRPQMQQSFQSIESGSFSQRIIKNGKEIVISSDGEDTDSDDLLEDPDTFFSSSKMKSQPAPVKSKKITSPKKWKYDLNSLVTNTVDDNEVEAKVAMSRANLGPPQGPDRTAGRLNESTLVSAIGEDEDAAKVRRTLDAVRRTEALNHDRVWSFFDNAQTLPSAPKFPQILHSPGTVMEVLKDPAARERLFVSGNFIELALSNNLLPDDIVLWMFHSIPYERRDDLSNAYCRIIKSVGLKRLRPLIRPTDVNTLLERLGARKDALDPSKEVTPTSHHATPTAPKLKDPTALISVLKMFRETTHLLADDTKEQIILVLLRMTLDSSLTADSLVSSELQRTIDDALNPANPYDPSSQDLLHRVCTVFFDTVKDVCLQGRFGYHMLPTSSEVALLRCRLAVSFLLKSPEPLDETPETLFDLSRLTKLLSRDERFQVKRPQGQIDYDWRELIALTALLNIAIDTSALNLNYQGPRAKKDFDADLDKLANQIKIIYSSIQVSGAAHMTLTLARGDLEALQYRILYSIRSNPPLKKNMFQAYGKEGGDIRSVFSKYIADLPKETNTSASAGSDAGDTGIPIR